MADLLREVRKVVKLYDHKGIKIGCCPFHLETAPSFVVDPQTKEFCCLSCGAHGNVTKFISLYYHLPIEEVERRMNHQPRPESKFRADLNEINEIAADYYNWRLTSEYGESCLSYFKRRGLTDETIRSFKLGYSCSYGTHLISYLKKKGYEEEKIAEAGLAFEKDGEYFDRFSNRAMFPLKDEEGRILGFTGRALDEKGEKKAKYMNTPETEAFQKRNLLYGMDVAKISDKKYFVLVEGNMDVISMHQAGFTNTVASCGTALTEHQCSLMKQYKDRVIVMYDSDTAGVTSTRKAIRLLREAGFSVTIANLTPYKDPDELIKARGWEEMVKRIKDVENYKKFLFQHDDPEEAIKLLLEQVDVKDFNRYIG